MLPYHNLQMKHWNPGASMPLILPVHVICNTSDEDIYSNVRANSRLDKKWIQHAEQHDLVAVLCGSGPSLADSIEEIKKHVAGGGIVFAMNAAAGFLNDHGILPDYQVILDARIETADLIGPAKEYLFASQVHPELFKRVPDARLWQLQVGGIDDLLPEYDKGYALIGGAASVGNTATCLAFAMGFRNLEIYGYDSSHRDGKGHAFHQKMNEGDPCAYVDFNGKTYLVSLTMKLQAEKFQDTAAALIASGCKIAVHGDGLLPDMFNAPKETLEEAEKYTRMWALPAYRTVSPGEECVKKFMLLVDLKGQVIDFGCGTGRASLRLKAHGCDVVLVDFTENSRDPAALCLPFVKHDLTKPIPLEAPYGFCADVMEHIPPDDVGRVVENIMACVKTAFFQISTVPDAMGAAINQTLHLTVRPHSWWSKLFEDSGYRVRWSEESEISSMFLVQQNDVAQPLNTPAEVMVAQAEQNLARDLPLFIGQEAHKAKLCIVGGAPSLKDTLPSLQFLKGRGALVLALNNTHDWLTDHGIVPDLHAMLDARRENVEFVRKPSKDTIYLIAAQCHPDVFDALKDHEVITWVADVPGMRQLAESIKDKPIGLVGGGSTVGLKAMMLAYLWGFRSLALFGFDSCYNGLSHHAYPQSLNDAESVVHVLRSGKRFACAPWMVAQAEDFDHDAKQLIERGCSIKTYGEGLIPTLLSEIQKGLQHAA